MRSSRTFSLLGVLACALAVAACGGGDDGTGGTGAVASGGGGGTNPQGGGGGSAGMNPQGGGGGTNPQGGGGGSGGMVTAGDGGGGGGGGATGGSGGGGGGSMMCETSCASTMDLKSDSTCENAASGIFAIKTVIPVWWQDDVSPPLVDPGRGFITVYLKGTLTDVCSDGSDGCGEMMGCGTILPPFVSWANCNAYQITFPDDLWDKPTMPKFYTHGSTTGFEPGATLTIAKATGLVGIALDDTEITWPSEVAMVSCAASVANGNDPSFCFPDHDGDGLPGISIKMGRIGENYRDTGCLNPAHSAAVTFQGAPLDGLFGALCEPAADPSCKRATDLSIGLRTRLGGGGEIAECTETTAQGVGASDADYLDSRVIGCKLNDGMDCTLENFQFVDSSAPFYNILDAGMAPPSTVMQSSCECPDGCAGAECPLDQTASDGPRSAVIRLGDVGEAIDCGMVRTAVETAFPGTDI